jgi:hypothetical protein
MGKETRLPCFENPEERPVCDCPLRRFNAGFVNNLATKKEGRGLRVAIQHEGYDKVSVGLIVELIRNPNGRYYTDLFEEKYPFSPKMREIRKRLLNEWRYAAEFIAEKNPDFTCPELKKSQK